MGGRRASYNWGPEDWKDFYWLCRIIFWIVAVIAAASIYYQVNYLPVCLEFGTYQRVESSGGKRTLIEEKVCKKWETK